MKDYTNTSKVNAINLEELEIDLERLDEDEYYANIMYGLFNNWQDSIIEGKPVIDKACEDLFINVTGASKKSPYFLMFAGFVAGVSKGMEVYEVLTDPVTEEGKK